MGIATYTKKVKDHFSFTEIELRGILITILILAFIYSFREWGSGDAFDTGAGIKNLLISILIVGLAVIVKEAGHRLTALVPGYKVEFKMWWNGLIIALILCFITRGYFSLFLLVGGGFVVYHLKEHRLGYFRYGTMLQDVSIIALMGPMANIAFAAIIKNIELYMTFIPLNHALVDKIFLFNLCFACVNLLPIPPLPGSKIFFHSRLVYSFIFCFVVGYTVLLYFFQVYSWIFALLIAVAGWLFYYISFEKKAWEIGY